MEQIPTEVKWIKATDRKRLDNRDYQFIKAGDKIRLYGEETIVEDFYFAYNEGTEKWETIIRTTKRGDPLERTIANIEVCEDSYKFPKQASPCALCEGKEKEIRESERQVLHYQQLGLKQMEQLHQQSQRISSLEAENEKLKEKAWKYDNLNK